jgi:hypothetical protein
MRRIFLLRRLFSDSTSIRRSRPLSWIGSCGLPLERCRAALAALCPTAKSSRRTLLKGLLFRLGAVLLARGHPLRDVCFRFVASCPLRICLKRPRRGWSGLPPSLRLDGHCKVNPCNCRLRTVLQALGMPLRMMLLATGLDRLACASALQPHSVALRTFPDSLAPRRFVPIPIGCNVWEKTMPYFSVIYLWLFLKRLLGLVVEGI